MISLVDLMLIQLAGSGVHRLQLFHGETEQAMAKALVLFYLTTQIVILLLCWDHCSTVVLLHSMTVVMLKMLVSVAQLFVSPVWLCGSNVGVLWLVLVPLSHGLVIIT